MAATGWLAQQASFAEVAESSQVVTLESEDFLCRPADALDRLQKHFGLHFDSASVANGPEFRRHSKDRTKFDPEQRARDRQARVEVYRREIDMVMEWSRRLADFAGVPKLLPHPLLPDANRPAF